MSISLQNIAVQAIEELHLPDNQELAWMMKRANDALRRIDCIETYVKETAELDVSNDGRCNLPCDYYKTLAINVVVPCVPVEPPPPGPPPPMPPPNSGNQPNFPSEMPTNYYKYNPHLWYADVPFCRENNIDLGGYSATSNTFYINGDTIQLYGNCNRIQKVRIAYMGYNVDDGGRMRALTKMEEAVMNFICWKYEWQREKFTKAEGYRKEWVALKNKIVGVSQRHQMELDRKQIQMTMWRYVNRYPNVV